MGSLVRFSVTPIPVSALWWWLNSEEGQLRAELLK